VSWPATVVVALFLLLTALTIPTAVIIAGLVVLQALRGHIRWRAALVWVVAVGLGLIAQWWTAAHAAIPRAINITMDSFTTWMDTSLQATLTFVPGISVQTYTWLIAFPISPSQFLASLFVLAVGISGVILLVRGWRWNSGRAIVGQLLLAGILVSAIPSILGGPSNRYLVGSMLLWAAALLVVLDSTIQRSRIWVLAVMAAVVLVVWWPLIPASAFRTRPDPPWASEVARVAAICGSDPARHDQISFSPEWPRNDGVDLSEPTNHRFSCFVGWKF